MVEKRSEMYFDKDKCDSKKDMLCVSAIVLNDTGPLVHVNLWNLNERCVRIGSDPLAYFHKIIEKRTKRVVTWQWHYNVYEV